MFAIAGAAIGGLILGGLAAFGALELGLRVSERFPPPPPPGSEFAIGTQAALYFILLFAGAVIGFIAVMRKRLAAPWRAFWIGFAVPFLGFYAVCTAFAIPQLGGK